MPLDALQLGKSRTCLGNPIRPLIGRDNGTTRILLVMERHVALIVPHDGKCFVDEAWRGGRIATACFRRCVHCIGAGGWFLVGLGLEEAHIIYYLSRLQRCIKPIEKGIPSGCLVVERFHA